MKTREILEDANHEQQQIQQQEQQSSQALNYSKTSISLTMLYVTASITVLAILVPILMGTKSLHGEGVMM